MRVILAVVITTTLISTPAVAQYVLTPGYSTPPAQPSAQPSAQKAKTKKTKATSSYAQQYRGSPYSSHPEYDVYVNGQYVGSDPDPRIRASLASEWRSQWGMR